MRLVNRPVLAAAVVAAIFLATSPRPVAAPRATPFERLVAKALNPSDKGAQPANIDIVIERWSTDEESIRLQDTVKNAGADMMANLIAELQTLQHTHRRAGIMELPGWQGMGSRARLRRSRIVQFARDIWTPSGRQVIVALDQPVTIEQPVTTILGTPGDRQPPQLGLDGLMVIRPDSHEFQLIDIRFGPDGKGIGKMATAGMLIYNEKTKTLELANYGNQPVRLLDVTSH